MWTIHITMGELGIYELYRPAKLHTFHIGISTQNTPSAGSLILSDLRRPFKTCRSSVLQMHLAIRSVLISARFPISISQQSKFR